MGTSGGIWFGLRTGKVQLHIRRGHQPEYLPRISSFLIGTGLYIEKYPKQFLLPLTESRTTFENVTRIVPVRQFRLYS